MLTAPILVHNLGEELFADTAFPADEHRQVSGSYLVGNLNGTIEGWAIADDSESLFYALDVSTHSHMQIMRAKLQKPWQWLQNATDARDFVRPSISPWSTGCSLVYEAAHELLDFGEATQGRGDLGPLVRSCL